MNGSGLFALAILAGTPLLLAVLGELMLELSGMINIGLEGLLLVAAMCGVLVAKATGSVALGFVGGIAGAIVMALLYGWLTIGRGADQIICGAGVNFVAAGVTSVAYSFSTETFVSGVPRLSAITIGAMNLPDGVALFAWLIAPVLTYAIARRTRFGLVTRACGEYPEAVRLHGMSVARHRWGALLFEAVCCGMGGAYISLALSSGFAENMVAGRGFIALAIVTFGRWRSLGSLVGVALFSSAVALQYFVQARAANVPFHLLLMLPYVLTLLVLIFFVRDVRAPASLGK